MKRQVLGFVLGFVLVAFGLSACGGGDPIVARKNLVFYDFTNIGSDGSKFEEPYPPLDLEARRPNPEYKGVVVLNGWVRISRPTNWVVRAASDLPGMRYIQYLSPREYIFSVYERQELPDALWGDVVKRFEKSLKKNRVEILHKGVPIATWNAQGRAYLLKRRVPAAKSPFVNVSREYLVRAENRVVLVQVVHPNVGVEPVSEELRRVFNTLELL